VKTLPPDATVQARHEELPCTGARDDDWGEIVTEFRTGMSQTELTSFYGSELRTLGWRAGDAGDYGPKTALFVKDVDGLAAQIRLLPTPEDGVFDVVFEYPPQSC
jgi:hypothetical protein